MNGFFSKQNSNQKAGEIRLIFNFNQIKTELLNENKQINKK